MFYFLVFISSYKVSLKAKISLLIGWCLYCMCECKVIILRFKASLTAKNDNPSISSGVCFKSIASSLYYKRELFLPDSDGKTMDLKI